MHANDLQDLLTADPFVPFLIELPNRMEYIVEDRRGAVLSTSGETLIIQVGDDRHLLNLTQIIRIIARKAKANWS